MNCLKMSKSEILTNTLEKLRYKIQRRMNFSVLISSRKWKYFVLETTFIFYIFSLIIIQQSEKRSIFNDQILSHYMQSKLRYNLSLTFLIEIFTLFVTKYAKKATAFKQYQIELTLRFVFIWVHRTANITR